MCPDQELFCGSFQLCEDLFSRVNVNQSAQLSYSVEVSPSLGAGRQEAWCPWAGMKKTVIKTEVCLWSQLGTSFWFCW